MNGKRITKGKNKSDEKTHENHIKDLKVENLNFEAEFEGFLSEPLLSLLIPD